MRLFKLRVTKIRMIPSLTSIVMSNRISRWPSTCSLAVGSGWRDDLAHANFKRLTDLRPELASLADYDRNLHSNLLLVIDYGWGPHLQNNFDGAIVGFRPLPSEVGPPPIPRVLIDGRVADTNATASSAG